jgi:hypothetical protein
MKITNIETFIVDAGWRPWTFVKVETDEASRAGAKWRWPSATRVSAP